MLFQLGILIPNRKVWKATADLILIVLQRCILSQKLFLFPTEIKVYIIKMIDHALFYNNAKTIDLYFHSNLAYRKRINKNTCMLNYVQQTGKFPSVIQIYSYALLRPSR